MTSVDGSVDVCVGSVLFTDLVGFTALTDVVGDVAALNVLEEQTRIVDALLDNRANARIVKELGDGLMIWLESACDALEFAIALMGAIEEARADGTFPLAVRMGIHHGEAITRGDDLVGQTVNIAARVSDLAGPGELLVSESVVAACGDIRLDLELQPIGPAVVKGVKEPIWLHRLIL